MPQRPKPPRAEWNAAEERVCAECGHRIPAGDRITWGVTGLFAHPPCVRDGMAAAIEHARSLRLAHADKHRKPPKR